MVARLKPVVQVAMRYVRQGSDLEVDKAQEEGSPLVFCNQLYDSAPHIVSATSIASESERYNQACKQFSTMLCTPP